MKSNQRKHAASSPLTAMCLSGLLTAPLIAQDTPLAEPAVDQFAADTSDGADVNVSSYLTVDLHVQDTELAKVLQMLSIQSQKNIIASKNVSAVVTADLYDVTFYEALSAILNANGYGFIEKGNFIYVYTLEEIEAIKQAEMQISHQKFDLNYLNAADAAAFITPLLSERGSVAINGEVAPGFEPDPGNGGENQWPYHDLMVVSDFPENIESIARLLSELDQRPQQVMVESTVLQTSLTENNAWGLDFSVVAGMDFLDLPSPGNPADALFNGSDADTGFQPGDNNGFGSQSTVGNTGGAGGMKIGVVSDDISIFLRVLDEVTDTTVISRPRVLTLNKQRGEILIGRRLGYLSTTSTETSTTQTVQFLDTGTQLIFRPYVSPDDGFVRMELKPSVSEGIIREVTSSDGAKVTIPDQITQELTTNVLVRDGHTIVLGGLFKEETTLTKRQVPILGDIPLVGAAFRGHEDVTRRSEIMFLITPTIMEDEYAFVSGQRANKAVDSAQKSARQDVLFWSNDRMTAKHNMRAQEALARGDLEAALWNVNQSLSLKGNQPRVIQLREKIVGERADWFDRSLLNTIMSKHPDDMSHLQHTHQAPIQEITQGEPMMDPLGLEFTGTSSHTESTEATTYNEIPMADGTSSAGVMEIEFIDEPATGTSGATEFTSGDAFDDMTHVDEFHDEFDFDFEPVEFEGDGATTPAEGSGDVSEPLGQAEPRSNVSDEFARILEQQLEESGSSDSEFADSTTESGVTVQGTRLSLSSPWHSMQAALGLRDDTATVAEVNVDENP